jgi:ribose transport system substrate-binding protein
MTTRDELNFRKGSAFIGCFGAVVASLTMAAAISVAAAAEAPKPDAGPDIKTMCGTKPAVVALADGFGGNTWRKTALAELKDEASKCPNISKVLYTDATGDPAKANSDLNSLVAQGVNVLVVYPDFGDATLPAIRAAHEAGVVVIPYDSQVSGKAGVDFDANVYQDLNANAKKWVNWLNTNLKEGTLLYFSGIAGNSFSTSFMDNLKKELAPYPKLKLLDDQFIVTNWSTADAQKATAGVIAKYGKIDAFITDFGPVALGIIRGFQQAGLKVPANAGLAGNNELNCLWMDTKAKGQAWPYVTLEGTTTIGRAALRHGMAIYEGTKDPEPVTLNTYIFADSFAGIDPKCDKQAPLDADLSGLLTPEQLKLVFKQ